MIYEEFYLVNQVKVGEDRLGNPILEAQEAGPYLGRLTEWTADDTVVYGRDLTTSARKLMTFDLKKEEMTEATSVKVDGKTYDIEKVMDMRRWLLVLLRGYR